MRIVCIFSLKMESEAISLGPVGPDSCRSCSRFHTCGVSSSPPSPVPVPVEIPVWEIDNGTHSRTCMRKILISAIMVLLVLILVVVILRSIF